MPKKPNLNAEEAVIFTKFASFILIIATMIVYVAMGEIPDFLANNFHTFLLILGVSDFAESNASKK